MGETILGHQGMGWQIQKFFKILCSTKIFGTTTSVWSSMEDYFIQCGEENDLISHPRL
jgi:hypothetical protein